MKPTPPHVRLLLVAAATLAVSGGARAAEAPIPQLRRAGTATELVVDGKPFLVRGGELGNSSATDLTALAPVWPRLAAAHLNTVLVPVTWDVVEPEEGRFDFTGVGRLLADARRQHLRLIVLWFGSWKNSMSCYVPAWVKTNQARFPRAEVAGGRSLEALSAFSDAARDADARAFAALMRFLRQADGRDRTVVMVQVENEVAMVDEAADRSAAARQAFAAPVPEKLVAYLQAHRATLAPELAEAWSRAGGKSAGTWQELFGAGLATDEIFMAWHFAVYVEAVARAGKAVYPLPMFANAALNRPRLLPGQYPSAGPLPQVADVWRAGAPSIDLLAPDIYNPNVVEWCRRYTRAGAPLFVPEAANGADAAVDALYAVGQHEAIGFSPFAIDTIEKPAEAALTRSYDLLARLGPLLARLRGQGRTAGFLLDRDTPRAEVRLGGYVVRAAHDYTFEWSAAARDGTAAGPRPWPRGGGLVIATGPDELIVAGSSFILTFAPAPDSPGDPLVGLLRVDEGTFDLAHGDRFVPGRRLSGDETHQGRHVRLPSGTFQIQRVKLYRYR